MNRLSFAIVSAAGLCSAALAQTGTQDQNSPASNASFNLDADFLVWQQQVRAAMAGTLEGIRFTFAGPLSAQATVRIRNDPAWSASPVLFTTTVTKTTAGVEVVFVNMTSANIQLTPGQVFVIETQGNNTGMNIYGSYVAPPGTPLYPEPLFLTGTLFADNGWRHGFQTYMIAGGGGCYANCDGSTTPPVLNVQDFSCFLGKFASGDPYANCDGSTTPPVLNVQDFSCFLGKFAAGCP